jgi:hypothetical protein
MLNLMLCDASGARWSVNKLARTIKDRFGALEAVRRLEAAGLMHRLGEFVFPMLAARPCGRTRSRSHIESLQASKSWHR